MPGVVLLRLRPRAVHELSGRLGRGSIVVSATNGKTTTARMVRSMVDDAGWHTVANTAGSNLLRGVAAALIDSGDAELGLFEVDEAALPAVAEALEPRVVLLMNLFRDQLDRYGELESLVESWRSVVAGLPSTTTLILNADDPARAHLGDGRGNVVYFGLDDTDQGRPELAHAADSTNCPRCDKPLDYDLISIGHMGHWRCEACGLTRPTPHVSLTNVETGGIAGTSITVATPGGDLDADLGVPGLHNAYNAAAAAAVGHVLGFAPRSLAAALSRTHAAFGRGERIRLDGRELVLLLAKNPAGANENVRVVTHDQDPIHILALLNDRTADGQDVSWIWDVDFEELLTRAATLTVGGDRGPDLALRFVYGGRDRDAMSVHPDLSDAIDHVLDITEPGATVVVLPTYTAMLDLRAELVRRGVAEDFWEDQ